MLSFVLISFCILKALKGLSAPGIDHCFVIDRSDDSEVLAAELYEPVQQFCSFLYNIFILYFFF